MSVTNSCSWKHPSFEKVRFCQQLGSQHFAGSLPWHEGWSSFHLILPFSTFHKLFWILVIPSRPFSANLRNTDCLPALRQVHLSNQYFTNQQEYIKYKLLTLGSWCTALTLSQAATDSRTISQGTWYPEAKNGQRWVVQVLLPQAIIFFFSILPNRVWGFFP